MDIPPPPTPSPTTTTTNVSGPDQLEPPNVAQPNRMEKQHAPPLTNGALRSHLHPIMFAQAYGRCNKNYSPSTGGHVLDGCGEFMPTRASTPTDPTFLNCDACGCHRSFHGQTDHYYGPPQHHVIDYQRPPNQNHHAAKPKSSSAPNSPSPSPISSSYPIAPNMFFAGLQPQPANHFGKKRFRSRFSVDQKEKMQKFAERNGWKMLKKDEEMILGFCMDIGVTKRVLKVWMHNHKNRSVKINHPEEGENPSTS